MNMFNTVQTAAFIVMGVPNKGVTLPLSYRDNRMVNIFEKL